MLNMWCIFSKRIPCVVCASVLQRVGARMRGGFNRVARRLELRRNATGGVGESGAWA